MYLQGLDHVDIGGDGDVGFCQSETNQKAEQQPGQRASTAKELAKNTRRKDMEKTLPLTKEKELCGRKYYYQL